MAYNTSTNTLVAPVSTTSVKVGNLNAQAASSTLSISVGAAKPMVLTGVYTLTATSLRTANITAPALTGFSTTISGPIPTYNVTYNLAPKQVWGS